MAINKIGVLGAGLMGAGIAQVAATSGYQVTVLEVNEAALNKGLGGIEKSLAKFIEKGSLSAEAKTETMARLNGTTKIEDLAESDIIIEAIIENLDIKRETYAKLDQLCPAHTIFASNTSSLSITEMMTSTSPERQRRFVGMHFFNPVPLMKLVEVVRTIVTDDEVYAKPLPWDKHWVKPSCKPAIKPDSSSIACLCRICWMRFACLKKAWLPP
jgi:3-hydroxybutyryl-CoA dehydrogenase